MKKTRREFLELSGRGAAGFALMSVASGCESFSLQSEGGENDFRFLTQQHAPDWYWFSALDYKPRFAPKIAAGEWTMDIRSGGKSVGEVTYRKLKALEADGHAVTYLKTMRCILGAYAAELTDTLTATGVFTGIPLRTVLDETSISGEVTKLRFEAHDGFQTSLSYDRVLNEELLPVMLAYELNGEPLIRERGGPVRVIVPEMWAYKDIKWVTSVDATTDFSSWGTFETGLYAGKPEIDNPGLMALMTLVTQPNALRATVQGPDVELRGMALVGGSKIDAVEVQVDGGEWVRGTIPQLDEVLDTLGHDALFVRASEQWGLDWPYPNVWAPWSYTARGLAPGPHQIFLRSVDRDGRSNPSIVADPLILAQQVILDLEVT